MARRRTPGNSRSRATQRGAALIIVLGLVATAIGTAIFTFASPASSALERERITQAALGQAKAALIAFALRGESGAGSGNAGTSSFPPNDRPGQFPCPDTDDDGVRNVTGANCTRYIGRLPWRTLGLPDLRDGSGERLWYALSPAYRASTAAPPTVPAINSDSVGSLTLHGADGTTVVRTRLVATIIAPGTTIAAQVRDATTMNCAEIAAPAIARRLCPNQYMEALGTANNANPIGPFASGAPSETFNDRLAVVDLDDFMPQLELRVANLVRAQLATFRSGNGYYPFAAAYDDASGNCARNVTRGRIPDLVPTPVTPAPPTAPYLACNPSAGGVNWPGSLPLWFSQNLWSRSIYYAVAPGFAEGGGQSCAGGCLTAGANPAVGAVFLMPGSPTGGQSRTGAANQVLTNYLEDAENVDGWSVGANDLYASPASTARNRDRIYTLP